MNWLEEVFYRAFVYCMGASRIKRTTGTPLDIEQGTDYIIDGIRVDVTTWCKNIFKLKAVTLTTTYVDEELTVYSFIKRSNGHHDLEQPVLVLQFDGAVHKKHLIVKFLEEHYDDVVDMFWNTVDELNLEVM